jgi:hypothetical protein
VNEDKTGPMDGDMGESMLDCEAVMKQLWDYLDQELTPDRMQLIEAHVHLCERCSPQVAFERSFLRALSEAGPGSATNGRCGSA